MHSYPQGRPTSRTSFWPASLTVRCPLADEAVQELNNQSVTRVFWIEPASDSYVLGLEKEVHDLRAQLAAKERELAAALSGHRDEDRNFDFPIEVEESFPARILEEIDLPFYFGGGEAEE